MTTLLTPRAVSVVIWIGPRCRVGKPKVRSSDVRSRGGSSPVERESEPQNAKKLEKIGNA